MKMLKRTKASSELQRAGLFLKCVCVCVFGPDETFSSLLLMMTEFGIQDIPLVRQRGCFNASSPLLFTGSLTALHRFCFTSRAAQCVCVCACVCVCVYVHACVSLSHAGQAAVCATMLCDCTAVSINLDSKGSDHVCLSSFAQQHTM